jgi:hypothetical protein
MAPSASPFWHLYKPEPASAPGLTIRDHDCAGYGSVGLEDRPELLVGDARLNVAYE